MIEVSSVAKHLHGIKSKDRGFKPWSCLAFGHCECEHFTYFLAPTTSNKSQTEAVH